MHVRSKERRVLKRASLIISIVTYRMYIDLSIHRTGQRRICMGRGQRIPVPTRARQTLPPKTPVVSYRFMNYGSLLEYPINDTVKYETGCLWG